MARKTTVVGFSVPPAVARAVEVMARYERLAAYGAAKASRVGVATEADLERLLTDCQFN